MRYIKFTEFRNHSKIYFDKVEQGDCFVIVRKGKPIAQILPFDENITGWKRKIKKVQLRKNVDTFDYILRERSES